MRRDRGLISNYHIAWLKITGVRPLLSREDDHEINRFRGVEEVSHPLAPFQFYTIMMGIDRPIDETYLKLIGSSLGLILRAASPVPSG